MTENVKWQPKVRPIARNLPPSVPKRVEPAWPRARTTSRVRLADATDPPPFGTAGIERRPIRYDPAGGVEAFVIDVDLATPTQLMNVEREGVIGQFFKDVSRHMGLPAHRMYDILGVPKATVEKKAAANAAIRGSGGQAAIGMARLIAIAQRIANESTAPQADGFDAAKWLGQWIERPQPALGGLAPATMLDTPTGIAVVARLLGSIESGAYQ